MTPTEIDARLDAIRAGLVKPLIWTEGFIASTPFCVYTVTERGENGYGWSRSEYPYHDEDDTEYATEDEAKQAAERDYRQRILSALDLSGIEALLRDGASA